MKDISVRSRIDDQQQTYENDKKQQEFFEEILESEGIDLRYSRATEWVEVKVKVPSNNGVEAAAGTVMNRQIRGANGESVYVGDPQADVVVADWSRKFGTLVTMHKTVARGDLMSYELPSVTHVLSITEQIVKKLTEYRFRSEQIVLDLMGGEKVPYRKSEVDYRTPGEILIMDLDGNFTIRNSSEDRANYLNWRFQEDETSEYNLNRRSSARQNSRDEEDDENSPFGGGRGG